MEGYRESCSELNLQTVDFCCLRPPERGKLWVFFREQLSENNLVNNSSFVSNPIKEKIRLLMNELHFELFRDPYNLVQFWAPNMAENRRYLATSDQPYALCSLHKGLIFFRKQCMSHQYFVDDEAKGEELGPPGRAFRNRHPEISPDLRLYSTREFPLRKHAAHCALLSYVALPLYDLNQGRECLGVLEFVGHSDSTGALNYFLETIFRSLHKANMSASHINFQPSFQITESWEVALIELRMALNLISKIPQLHMTEVWVPYNECASLNSDISCMELAEARCEKGFTWDINGGLRYVPRLPKCEIHAPTNKGIARMIMASEDKSCFCLNSSDFRIGEQPLAHYARRTRLDVCFGICLKSSHTGNLRYFLEFFLHQGPATCEYLRSFLNFLLPIMKRKLTSFKVASGKQLGEELVVEVIQFSEINKFSFSEKQQPDIFPVKFKFVQHGQKDQHTNDQGLEHAPDGMDSVTNGAQGRECSSAADNSNKDDASKKTEKGKGKSGGHLITLEDLKPHIGEKLEDVAEVLGVGRSTIKRVLRENNISRWPNKKKHKNNLSLFTRESASCEIAQDSQQNMRPSSSGDLPLQKNVPQANIESTQHLTVQAEVEKVIIKVKYGDDFIRLDFCLSSGMDKLVEEAAAKLNLKRGSFKLKYLDEDNDEILFACDADLERCLKSLKAEGKTCIHLFVHQNVPQTNMSAQQLAAQEEAEKVIIKVKYADDTIILDSGLSSGMGKLFEEVSTKLNLEKGSFKMKYLDEDNDEILLVCDADLQRCPRSRTAKGKAYTQLFVQLIRK